MSDGGQCNKEKSRVKKQNMTEHSGGIIGVLGALRRAQWEGEIMRPRACGTLLPSERDTLKRLEEKNDMLTLERTHIQNRV